MAKAPAVTLPLNAEQVQDLIDHVTVAEQRLEALQGNGNAAPSIDAKVVALIAEYEKRKKLLLAPDFRWVYEGSGA